MTRNKMSQSISEFLRSNAVNRDVTITPSEVTSEIRITDCLTIRTRNSIYQFFIIDPVRAFGMVRGGVIGPRAAKAFFCSPGPMKAGEKARWCIESQHGVRFITTSTITSIKVSRC